MVLGILQRYPGYTYSSLMEEDPELIRLMAIRGRDKKPEAENEEVEEVA